MSQPHEGHQISPSIPIYISLYHYYILNPLNTGITIQLVASEAKAKKVAKQSGLERRLELSNVLSDLSHDVGFLFLGGELRLHFVEFGNELVIIQ